MLTNDLCTGSLLTTPMFRNNLLQSFVTWPYKWKSRNHTSATAVDNFTSHFSVTNKTSPFTHQWTATASDAD